MLASVALLPAPLVCEVLHPVTCSKNLSVSVRSSPLCYSEASTHFLSILSFLGDEKCIEIRSLLSIELQDFMLFYTR